MSWRLLASVLFVAAWGTAPIPARSQPAPPKAPLKIYIVTDLEGASGVYKFSQTREADSPLYRPACECLMGDLAAVVRGLRDGGVQEILVLDGHGLQAFVPELMEAGAKYITGKPYTVQFPAKAKKTYLVFDKESPDGKLVTKEGEIATPLEIFSF